MLRTLFQWFDTHPNAYWVIAAFPSLLWLGSIALSLREARRRRNLFWDETVFATLMLGVLVAWRWPFWLNANPYNPDESQFIAGAITLTRDPVFWRAVDGTTSGPLNFYALLPLRGLGMPLDYFTARVTGTLLVWISILACYRLIRSWYGAAPGRLAAVPFLAFFAAATDADFVHYSSEHVPLALMGVAAWGLFGQHSDRHRKSYVFGGALVAGMLPWAKLQTAPIALTLIIFALGQAWRDRNLVGPARVRRIAEIGLASSFASLLVLLLAGVTGQLSHLYRDYLVQNLSYIDQPWTMSFALRQLLRYSLETGNLPAFGAVTLGGVFLAGVLTKCGTKKAFLAAGLFCCIAALCVVTPKRPSLHYTLLLIVPLGIWAGIAIGELWSFETRPDRPRWRSLGVAFIALCLIFGTRVMHGSPDMMGHFSDHWRHPRSAAGNIARTLTTRDDRIAVWGWMDRIYVETGLPQATRESETFEQLAPSRQQQHYRARYVSDLVRTRPAIFVDATGPGAPYFSDRAAYGHEIVPALTEFLKANYCLLTDLGNARIYVRSDRFRARPLSNSELWRMIADSRRDPDLNGPESVFPQRLAKKQIYGRKVQMVLPPAQMVWALDGTEREVVLEYGFDPRAYRDGKGNGAEILVELHPPEGPPRVLLKRALDPVKRPDDRGNLSSRVVLPPFPLGSKLVARTTPGEFGDNAWDWVYVGALDRIHAPFFSPHQFPNYARVPDTIVSEYTSLLDDGQEKLLMTHAPTTMQFSLKGRERRWQFDYGLQPGAYTGEGRSDGATFIVELLRGSGAAEVLFSRPLNPAIVEADRGRQHCDLSLPPVETSDKLVMRIDPGPTLGWDWTYITHLEVGENAR